MRRRHAILSSAGSVRECAEVHLLAFRIFQDGGSAEAFGIDVAVLNTGLLQAERRRLPNGWETTVGCNFLLAIVRNNVVKNMSAFLRAGNAIAAPIMKVLQKRPEQGCRSILHTCMFLSAPTVGPTSMSPTKIPTLLPPTLSSTKRPTPYPTSREFLLFLSLFRDLLRLVVFSSDGTDR